MPIPVTKLAPDKDPEFGESKPTKAAPAKRGRGRPPGVRTAPSLEKALIELLTGFNTVPQAAAAFGRLKPDDPLSDDEIKKLAHALDVQARRNPAFGKWLTRFVQGGESLGLIFVLASIAGKRIINHLPEGTIDPGQGEMLKGMMDIDPANLGALFVPTADPSMDEAPTEVFDGGLS